MIVHDIQDYTVKTSSVVCVALLLFYNWWNWWITPCFKLNTGPLQKLLTRNHFACNFACAILECINYGPRAHGVREFCW